MKARRSDFNRKDFEKMYAEYFPKLVRFSHSYILSLPDAENIVQDVFLYLWEHEELTCALNNIPAFLFTSVKNRCIDYLRNRTRTAERNQSLSEVCENELKLKLYSLQQFDENRLSPAEMETCLTNAIHTLPKRCREIFVLSRLEGLCHKKIAERLHISVNTVEGQIAIALKKLRVKLKNHLFLLILISDLLPLVGIL